jgi:hypothetical protein
MIVKTNLLHPGWSCGNGNDQYDNESIGSTKSVFSLERLVENSKKKEKNDKEIFISSSYNDNGKQGCTAIEANGSRKTKTKNREQTIIDSIISSINIELKIVKNGAPEAKIESPVRKSRCTIPNSSIDSTKGLEFNLTKNGKQKLTPPVGVDEDEETNEQDVAKEIVKRQRNNKHNKNIYLQETTKQEVKKV